MSELLKTYDLLSDNYVDARYTLSTLIMSTLNGNIGKSYAIYQLPNDSDETRLRKILVASHKDQPGGYGLSRVAISVPGRLGITVIGVAGDEIIAVHNNEQTPLPEHRDLIHYFSVLNEYFYTDPRTLIDFLENLKNEFKYLESSRLLFPGTEFP